MQIVSNAYKAYMSQPVRPPFHMEITVHTDTPIVYTDNEIFEFEEKKTAHPIGAELPTIEVSFKVDNIKGDYKADSPSGLYEQLIKGVKVTYRYGLEIPNIMPYGYPADAGETEEPIYGSDPLNPYGFSPSFTIEWIDGGEVYTTGEISYDKTSATIEAVDALSFLEEKADVAYGTITRKQCAEFIIGATEYPEDALGAKKISIDNVLETWQTNVVSDKNAKQVLQSLAHASGVQMYIDRSGYLHLDKIPITTDTVDYHLTLGDQDEDGEFTKGKTPRKVVVKVNTKNVVPEVSETINPKGEDILVENDFVQTTLQAEAVLPWVKRYLDMRNTAEIEYAGDPSLDVLDIVLLDTEYSENIQATIVESTIHFDGAITGSLVLRYDSTLTDNTTVKITGAENFIYNGETPSPASVTLVCETDMTAPSYEWSYFNDSSNGWQVISGATTANLTILADSAYMIGSNPTSFRVVVRGGEGAKGTTVRIQRVQEAVTHGRTYLGKLSALPSAYDVGDYFLVSTAFGTYGVGDVVQWDGDSWEVTSNPALIVTVYQDALTLDVPLENTSAVNQYIRSIQTKQILLSTDTPIMFFYEDDTPYDGGQVATITATRKNVIAGINWYINGDLVPDYDEDTINVYDTDMSGNEITVTAVSVEYANVSSVIKIAKKKDRKLDASNLGLITNGDPTPTVGKEGAPLVAGDYFMWGNPTTSTPDERKKGAVYIYQTNDTWLEDTDGTKTMSMFAQFADLANDVDSTVIGNAVIKKLAVIEAFINELTTNELTLSQNGSIASSYDDNGEMKRYQKGMIDDDTLPENFGGFLLESSGYMELVRVRARDGEYSGVLDSSDDDGILLYTQKYELGRQLPVPPKTYYLASDISAIFPDKASKEVSIDEGSYVHAFKPTIVEGKYNLVARTLNNSRTIALPEIKGTSSVVVRNNYMQYINKIEYSKNGGAFTAMSGSVGVSVSQGDDIRIRQTYNNPNAFVGLGQTARDWVDMTTLGNDVYACVYKGDIYKQTNGTGDFVALGQTSKQWQAMTTLGNDVYACVWNGDIYKQTNGTGDFVALGQTTRGWYGMTTLGNDVYACVADEDIYKQTNGTGDFVALGQASRDWLGMTTLGNDVYACVYKGDIYKQTNGTGDFVALGQTSRNWRRMTTLGNDVYASVQHGGIYKQTNGTGDFVVLWQTLGTWEGMTTLGNDVYVCEWNGDIYKQTYNPTHQSTISIALPNTEALVLACTNASTANGTYDDFNGEVIAFDTANDQSEKSVVIKNGGTTLFDSALNLYRTFKTVYDDLGGIGTYSLDDSQSTVNGTQAGYVVKSQNQLTFLTLTKAVIATIGSTTYTKIDAILYLLGQTRGVKTATLLPETGASIGTAQNPYSEGYFENIVSNTFSGSLDGNVTGNVNAAGTSNKVYGAVFN